MQGCCSRMQAWHGGPPLLFFPPTRQKDAGAEPACCDLTPSATPETLQPLQTRGPTSGKSRRMGVNPQHACAVNPAHGHCATAWHGRPNLTTNRASRNILHRTLSVAVQGNRRPRASGLPGASPDRAAQVVALTNADCPVGTAADDAAMDKCLQELTGTKGRCIV